MESLFKSRYEKKCNFIRRTSGDIFRQHLLSFSGSSNNDLGLGPISVSSWSIYIVARIYSRPTILPALAGVVCQNKSSSRARISGEMELRCSRKRMQVPAGGVESKGGN